MLPGTRELRKFNDIVRMLYVPQSEVELRRTVASRLLDLIPGVNAWVSDLDLERLAILAPEGTHSVLSSELLELAPQLLPHHPLGACFSGPGAGLCAISDLVGRGAWHRNPVYNAYYRPTGFEDQLCACFDFRGARCGSVAVLRDRRGFSEKDRLLLSLLRPHLDQAFKNARRLAPPPVPVSAVPVPDLSPREIEVLQWIAQGKRNEEIAVILGLSVFTVKNHAKRIFSRLGVETRTAAVAAASRHPLLRLTLAD